jgi:alpha-L-fucosidase
MHCGNRSTPQETPEQYQQRMAWWQQARFGCSSTWGSVSRKGTDRLVARRQRAALAAPARFPRRIRQPLQAIQSCPLQRQEWVGLAQDAGMKYLVFTSRHHDGFSMFDSALTDYKITNSPFGRDVARELANACHQANLRLGFYYSPPDWHHPDYRTENHARFLDYFHGQVRELCTNYGRLDILWFDGLGGTAKDWDSEKLFPMIRSLQPQIVINNRAGLAADQDTPEQEIGKFQNTRPWESCITICNQWAWKPDDTMKSLKQCLDTHQRRRRRQFVFMSARCPTAGSNPARPIASAKWVAGCGCTASPSTPHAADRTSPDSGARQPIRPTASIFIFSSGTT